MAKEVMGDNGIIVKIPENTVRLEVTASVMNDDGNIEKMLMTLNPDALYEVRKDFMDLVGDDDYDAVYVTTEKGKEWLNERERKRESETY